MRNSRCKSRPSLHDFCAPFKMNLRLLSLLALTSTAVFAETKPTYTVPIQAKTTEEELKTICLELKKFCLKVGLVSFPHIFPHSFRHLWPHSFRHL